MSSCNLDDMRPERAVVKKAIVDAGGNKRRAAELLGCTRQSLYTWIYQFGLERMAGVCMDTRSQLDTRECRDTKPSNQTKSGVYSGSAAAPTLRLVDQAAAAPDYPIQATLRVPASLWKRVKIEAIQRNTTVGALVGAALEIVLREDKPEPKRGRKGEEA
jgi:hypothetical protein